MKYWPQILGAGLLTVIGLVVYAGRLSVLERTLLQADPDAILADSRLAKTALRIGRQTFRARCALCHGAAGAGPKWGVPSLLDTEFLYGAGLPSEIEAIVLHGIRSGDSRGFHLASMPAFGTEKPYGNEPISPLNPAEIDDVVNFILSQQQKLPEAGQTAARGKEIYVGRGACYDCHGADGSGDPTIGAPNLIDSIALYGNGSKADLTRSITYGRAGVCPAFGRILSPLEIRAVSVYAAALHQKSGESQ